MPAVPPGIAAYVRRRGPLAGRGAFARFRSLPWRRGSGYRPVGPLILAGVSAAGMMRMSLRMGDFVKATCELAEPSRGHLPAGETISLKRIWNFPAGSLEIGGRAAWASDGAGQADLLAD